MSDQPLDADIPCNHDYEKALTAIASGDPIYRVANITEHWGKIYPRLAALAKKLDMTWAPEDVYSACLGGKAFLHVVPEGFFVVETLIDSFSHERYLHVWLAIGKGVDLVRKYQPAIEAIAKANGYKRITFASPRRGWERNRDWKVKTVTYERLL